jgi:hypothetical protein
LQNVHVLIVDDEPLARVALANLLSSGGDVLHFDLAADAIEALSRLKTASYDLVLLDINMAEQRQPERIAIKTNGRILFIKPEEVLSSMRKETMYCFKVRREPTCCVNRFRRWRRSWSLMVSSGSIALCWLIHATLWRFSHIQRAIIVFALGAVRSSGSRGVTRLI